MPGGVPDLYVIDSSGNLALTVDGQQVGTCERFKYLDFMRHQFKEQLKKANEELLETRRSLGRAQREWLSKREKIDQDFFNSRISAGIRDSRIVNLGEDPESWWWKRIYQKEVLQKVWVLQASHDLIVARMNVIGSRR